MNQSFDYRIYLWQGTCMPREFKMNQKAEFMSESNNTIETLPTPGVVPEQQSEENRGSGNPISAKKLAANRRNAERSTGPRTEEGKRRSRRNAIKHGMLSSVLLIKDGDGTEDAAAFARLFADLRRDLAPVGMLEDMMVESIAVAYWRARRAIQCENGVVRERFASWKRDKTDRYYRGTAEQAVIDDDLRIPLGDGILRYEAANNRHLATLLNQLDRRQCARKEEKPSSVAD
jgi:hypothetical protein